MNYTRMGDWGHYNRLLLEFQYFFLDDRRQKCPAVLAAGHFLIP